MRNIKITFLLALCGVFLCGQYSYAGCVDRSTDLANSTGCTDSQCSESCSSFFDGDDPRLIFGTLPGVPAIRPTFDNLQGQFASMASPEFDKNASILLVELLQGTQRKLHPPPGISKKNLTVRG
jgi:hypothetical protein